MKKNGIKGVGEVKKLRLFFESCYMRYKVKLHVLFYQFLLIDFLFIVFWVMDS